MHFISRFTMERGFCLAGQSGIAADNSPSVISTLVNIGKDIVCLQPCFDTKEHTVHSTICHPINHSFSVEDKTNSN